MGGDFTTAGGVTANNITKWNGTAFVALDAASGTGTDGAVFALASHDDGTDPALYAGGDFTTAGGVTVNNIANWDGVTWSGLDGPSGTGTDNGVLCLAEFDGGSGSTLVAGGYFSTAGGVTANQICKWNGSAFSSLSGPSGVGASGIVEALAAFDDGLETVLYAGGSLYKAGGLTSSYIAAWRCEPGFLFGDGFECGNTSAWSSVVP